MKAHDLRADDLHLADRVAQYLGRRALVAVEAELHVLGRDGIAVVEFQIGTQLELVRLAVGTLLQDSARLGPIFVPG